MEPGSVQSLVARYEQWSRDQTTSSNLQRIAKPTDVTITTPRGLVARLTRQFSVPVVDKLTRGPAIEKEEDANDFIHVQAKWDDSTAAYWTLDQRGEPMVFEPSQRTFRHLTEDEFTSKWSMLGPKANDVPRARSSEPIHCTSWVKAKANSFKVVGNSQGYKHPKVPPLKLPTVTNTIQNLEGDGIGTPTYSRPRAMSNKFVSGIPVYVFIFENGGMLAPVIVSIRSEEGSLRILRNGKARDMELRQISILSVNPDALSRMREADKCRESVISITQQPLLTLWFRQPDNGGSSSRRTPRDPIDVPATPREAGFKARAMVAILGSRFTRDEFVHVLVRVTCDARRNEDPPLRYQSERGVIKEVNAANMDSVFG